MYLLSVKIIDEAIKKALYIDLDSKKGKKIRTKKKPTREKTRISSPPFKKGGILIGIASIVIWMSIQKRSVGNLIHNCIQSG
jgi:hypothetical protein